MMAASASTKDTVKRPVYFCTRIMSAVHFQIDSCLHVSSHVPDPCFGHQFSFSLFYLKMSGHEQIIFQLCRPGRLAAEVETGEASGLWESLGGCHGG
jgi:hypothetical protein